LATPSWLRRAAGLVLTVALMLAAGTVALPAAAAATPINVLFYGPTAGGLAAQTPGITATVWDEATWASKKTADFAAFNAIVFGDEPACGVTPAAWATAIANRNVWSAALTGNITVNGTDPDYHGKPQFVQQSVLFAAAGHGTGLYASLSCAFHTSTATPVPVDLLGGLGTFEAQSVGSAYCPVSAHIVATHPSLDGLTDAYMSGWSCSAHEGFTAWPANFSPLVITTDASTAPYTASDGTHGLVYVLASGARTAGLSLTPRSASGAPGAVHAVIARQADTTDTPQAGVALRFAVTAGPNIGVIGRCAPVTCLTGAYGQVSWTYTGGPGSGDDTIVAFVDGNSNGVPDLGEAQTTALMTWDSNLGKYVSLGDSFSSGEGNPPFDTTPFDTTADGCHRSSQSYPHVAWVHTLSIPAHAEYWACSGAVIPALTTSFKSEPAQLSHIDSSTTLVTLTLGGNDAYFPDVLDACVKAPCAKTWEPAVSSQIALLGNHSYGGSLYQAYRAIKAKAATGARILVLGYPRFFPAGGSGGLGCSLILNGDEKWINQKVHDMDAAVRESALAAGVEYVDTENAFTGHELCSGNGLPSAVNSANPIHQEYSFHPNALGHQLLAGALETALVKPATGSFDLLPLATVTSTHTVAVGSGFASFTTAWPGSDVQMSLVSPSGQVIDRSTVDPAVLHSLSPTNESYEIRNPQPGVWTVRLYGADVAFDGEAVTLSAEETPVITPHPKASFTQSATTVSAGTPVAFDATGSTGGSALNYAWDFGDGTAGTGVKPIHSYATAGSFTPQLTVTDAGGDQGFTDNGPITVSPTAGGPLLDSKATADGRGTTAVAISTPTAGDTLLAFVAADGEGRNAQRARVNGGGLRWTLVGRTNRQGGTAEVWTAHAAGPLSAVRIRGSLSDGDYRLSLTVVAFAHAGGVGHETSASSRSGSPTVTLPTSAANSWVFAVGNDPTTATARAVGLSQVLVSQTAARRTTHWVQSQQTAAGAAGTPVLINDSAPITDRWNITAVEVLAG
jgi:PKD repeat protein/lysophospholipase L1-like esterase